MRKVITVIFVVVFIFPSIAIGQLRSKGNLAQPGIVSFDQSIVQGWSSTFTKDVSYKKVGGIVFVYFHVEGISNSALATFTLPYPSSSQQGFNRNAVLGIDDSYYLPGPALLELGPNGSTAYVMSDWERRGWSKQGIKAVIGNFWYFTDF